MIKNHEKDFQRFHMQKDEMSFSKFRKRIIRNQFCYLCDQKDHEENTCLLLNYNPNMYNFISKEYLQNVQFKRRRFKRH